MFRILADTYKRDTKPPAMPRWLKMLFLLAIGLIVVLAIMFFGSDSPGGPAGLATLMFYLFGFALLIGLVLWSFLTWVIYSALHNTAPWWRRGMTLLFFLMPAISLADISISLPQAGDSHDPVSKQAVTLAGIVFPAGSKLEYDDEYGGGDHTLIGAQASAPLSLGSLSVTEIRLQNPPHEQHLRVMLSSPQTIDGWHCHPDDSTEITRTNGRIALDYCMLAGQTIGNTTWPPGSYVRRSTAGWSVFASTIISSSDIETCTRPIVVAGVPYVQVSVNYDEARQKLAIDNGTPCKRGGSG